MPEIVEAQVLVDSLESIVNHQILRVEKLGISNIINKEEEFSKFVEGSTINKVFRVGKRPCLELEKEGQVMLLDIFLSMSGAVTLNNHHKYSRVKITLSDELDMYYVDSRKWGRMTLRTKDQYYNKFRTNAVDAMHSSDKDMTHRLLAVEDKGKSMKSVLMNQGVILGLGNIYAQEALHKARIHPQSKLEDISESKIDELSRHIKSILDLSYELGGLSMRDYIHTDGSKGSSFDKTRVYRKKNCKTCGHKVSRIKQSGRSTYYCLECQPVIEKGEY